LHALVALAFLGPRPTDKHEVNHLNGVKTDNTVENLQWVTRSENIKHAFDTGLKPSLTGSNAPSSKLTAEQVKEIIALYSAGTKIRELVQMFPVGDHAIRQIVFGRSHKEHERPKNPNTLKGAVRLNREKILAAKRMLFEDGLSAYKVANALGIGATTAYAIQKGKIWAHINP
jgi:transposase